MLENVKIDTLEFIFAEEKGGITMVWKGKSVMENPQKSIHPHIEGIIEHVKDVNFAIDFRKLEYMNSGTVQPIVWLLKKLDDKNIKTTVIYDKDVKWQNLSFQALLAFSDILKNVTIEGLAR